MNARERLDEIEYRLASPMVTYKENATEDAPALVAALRAVLDLAYPDYESAGGDYSCTVTRGQIKAAIEAHLRGAQ